jgi:hypothetical protein
MTGGQGPFGVQLPLNGMGDGEDGVPTPGEAMPLIEGGNPAWNSILQHIPEDKRQEVVPTLQEWDQNFQSVQETHAPWKEFSESGVDPETARLALNVLNTIENNPQQAYQTIGNALGITPGQAQEVVENLEEEVEEAQTEGISVEQFNALQTKADAMAQILLGQRQESLLAEQEQQLDNELSSLKDKHGEFPEQEVVYRMMHNGMTAEDALKDYQKFEENLLRNRRPAPKFLTGGGNIPTPKVNPTELDDKQTRDLVAEILTTNAQQNQ